MTSRSKNLLLSIRPDILQDLCRHLFGMETATKTKRQIVSELTQQQSLTIIMALPSFLF